MNEETASLSLKTYGEEGRESMVSEALDVTINRSQIYCILLRSLWLRVAGRGGNGLGFGERTNRDVAFLNGPSEFIHRSMATDKNWREDIAKGLVISPSFQVSKEPESMKSVDPPLVLTEIMKYYIRPVFRKRTGSNPRCARFLSIAEIPQHAEEKYLTDSKDSKQVHKRLELSMFTH
jgi:hypothetical protein